MKGLVILLVVVLGLTACGGGGGSVDSSSPNTNVYFPSILGSSITRTSTGSSYAETETVTQNSSSSIVTKTTDNQSISTSYDKTTYILSGNSVAISSTTSYSGSSSPIISTYSPPFVILPANLAPGSTATSSSVVTSSTGSQVPVTNTLTITVTINGIESVTVPSGTYQALKVSGSVTIASSNITSNVIDWYAPNIGLIKEQVSSSSGPSTSIQATSTGVTQLRFIDNNNGTIYDSLNNISWLKNISCFGMVNGNAATSAARTLASGQCGLSDGSKAGDWTSPTIANIHTMYSAGYTYGDIDSAGFINPSFVNHYWLGDSGYAWAPYEFSVFALGANFNTNVWPVRSGK